jgi:hypothetical protein
VSYHIRFFAGMTIACYDYFVTEDFFRYEFYSEGPNGKIKKVISFTRVNLHGIVYFNLAFGDAEKDGINDIVSSNNQDAEKVLATVAQAVISFTSRYPDAIVFAEGSTPSRTRRYQMGVNKFWKEIEPDFDVYGLLINGEFERFRSGINYIAFACKRKKR